MTLILDILVVTALPVYMNMTTTSQGSTTDHNARALAAALKSVAVKSNG